LSLIKNGLINIFKTYGIKEKRNSDKKQIKKMNFGFSSRVKDPNFFAEIISFLTAWF